MEVKKPLLKGRCYEDLKKLTHVRISSDNLEPPNSSCLEQILHISAQLLLSDISSVG